MFQNGKGLFGGNPLAMQQEQGKPPRQGGIGGFLQRNQMPLAQIADTLLRYSGSGGSPVLARLQQQQDMQQIQGFRTQQAKQQQDAEQQQWMARQAWERANPEPQQPTAMQRNLEYFMTLGPEQRAAWQDMNPEYRVGPDGQFYRVDTASSTQLPPETLPADYNFDGPPQGAPQSMNAPQGGRQTLTVENASRVRASMPAGRAGDEQFANWLRANNVQIGAF